MRPLVIVRPQPGADATAQAAEALGLQPIIMPLFAIEPVDWEPPDAAEYDGLLLTSANATRQAGAGLERLRSLPAYCVGAATAEAARETGLAIEAIGTGGVDALLESLSPKLRLLHLCGADRREAAVRAVEAIPVYRSAGLSCPVRFHQVQGAVVAVHSPRAGSAVARCVDEAGLDRGTIGIAAISAEAANAAGSGWARIETAAAPADPALLAIALRLCNNLR